MSELKPLYSVEETLRIQTVKLNQQLNKLLEQNTQIIELTADRDNALAQNAELASQVEALRKSAQVLFSVRAESSEIEPLAKELTDAIYALEDVINAAPTQHLRDHDSEVVKEWIKIGLTPEQYHDFKVSRDGLALQAEAGRAGYQACLQNIGYHEPEWQDDANAYAEKVRSGEA